MLTREKNWEAIRGSGYRFVPKGGTFPSETMMLVVTSSVCEKHIPKPAPNGIKFVPRHVEAAHDSMPSFMNFRRVLDLLEFKNQASQCFAGNQRCPGV